jgi:exodeoxyribonuclease V alpha subunit
MRPQVESPQVALAQGFAAHVHAWAKRAGANDMQGRCARIAAYRASVVTSEGDVCTTLQALEEETSQDAATLREALLASGVTGTPTAPGAFPLILDEDGRLYLHRYFDHERRLAQRLVDAAQAPSRPVTPAVREQLVALFGGPSGEVDWQQVAAALALRQRFTIVSGGPGTGKTTTVVNLLACLLAQDPDCRIALTAPTGKAAARMTEAIRRRASSLPDALRERLPAESFTIHRLLHYNPDRGAFAHNASNPLAFDVLVVDEASMLDLALAARLFDAMPSEGRVVLMGDKHQLSAVESGAVFAELCADPSLTPACRAQLETLCGLPPGSIRAPDAEEDTGLHDTAVWLTRNYRFDAASGIAPLAADINAGRATHVVDTLRREGYPAIGWHPGADAHALAVRGYEAYLQTVARNSRDIAAIAKAFDACRVLCAVKEGRQGVDAINASVTHHARRLLAAALPDAAQEIRSPWFAGRPVMVLANDYTMRLFNGDIGIALPDAQGQIMVFFPEGEGWRAVAPARLPIHETAFAITVHKSQGSEWDEVLVVLPERDSPVLTRELVYTAVTRARGKVGIWASEAVLAGCIARRSQRTTGLVARLREAKRVDPAV